MNSPDPSSTDEYLRAENPARLPGRRRRPVRFWLKRLIKGVLGTVGYEIVRSGRPGAPDRPVGSMRHLLEDLRRRGLRFPYILDVGANQCHWSRMAVNVFPEAHVLLIEPQQEMEPFLKEFSSDGLGHRYVVAAAAASSGARTLYVAADRAGSSLLESPELAGAGTDERTVPTVRIDDIIGAEVPGLVKLDIQGFELEALAGAKRLVGVTDVFILETSFFEFLPGQALFDDVFHFMESAGYCIYDFPGFLRRPFDGALGQADVCFVRRTGPLRRSHAWA